MTHQEAWNVVGGNVRRLRRDAGLTQSQLGELVGVTATTICRIESGVKDYTVGLLIDIAEALHEPPDLLLRSEKLQLTA